MSAIQAPEQVPWPDASELPGEEAPAIEWARFYRDRLGWIPLPTASRADVGRRAAQLVGDAIVDYQNDYKRDPTEEELEALREEAEEIAWKASKGPLGWVRAADYNFAGSVDDALLEKWWGGQRGYRGICIRSGRSFRGWPVVVLDVDPRHGGDVAGPWSSFPGPSSETPSGGRHVLLLGTGGPGVPHGEGIVADGVDLVSDPGVTLNVPSGLGSSSPGRERRWIRWEAPEPIPEAVIAAARARRPQHAQAERRLGDGTQSGRAAYALAHQAGDGERTPAAKAIVGILARPAACPEDVVRAALELLAEDLAGRDQGEAAIRAECERWAQLLTRGPRTVEFAVEVVETWSRVRDDAGRKRWRPGRARMVARSMWRTADRREEGKAGAEDHRIGPALADEPDSAFDDGDDPVVVVPETGPEEHVHGTMVDGTGADGHVVVAMSDETGGPPAADLIEEHDHEPPGGEVPDGPIPYPPPRPEEARAAARAVAEATLAAFQRPQWQGRLFRSFAESYSEAQFDADLERQPVELSFLPLFRDPLTGAELPAYLCGHGVGPWLGGVLGGLVAGDCKAIGAASAKGGKTYFVGQPVDGLSLQTAMRLARDERYAQAPLVVPFWLSEMPVDGELVLRGACRLLGVSMKAITRGKAAADDLDVRAAAERLRGRWPEVTPELYVRHVRDLVRAFLYAPDSPLGLAYREVCREVDLSVLPHASGSGRTREDPRGGPTLVGHVADEIQFRRSALAQAWGVPESEIQPLVVWDPLQRFSGDESDDAKRAIDRLLGAIVERLCRRQGGVQAIVLLTSDTTKGAATNVKLDEGSPSFLNGDPRELCAAVFAGSQGIMHHADCLAIYSEPPAAGSSTTTTWARVLQARTGASPTAFPFEWETWCGRFSAQEPGRPRVAGGGGGAGQGGGAGRRGGRQDQPARPFGAAPLGRQEPQEA
jgi:hypothetical protein